MDREVILNDIIDYRVQTHTENLLWSPVANKMQVQMWNVNDLEQKNEGQHLISLCFHFVFHTDQNAIIK